MSDVVEEETSTAGPSSLHERRRLLRLLLAVVVTIAATGWLVGSRIRSPADAAREREPPEPSVLTAPVERRRLGTSIVTRGDGGFAGSTDLTVDPGGGTDELAAGRPVVTGAVPRAGSELQDGAVALEISGRPVFVLAGELPMYRTLQPGLSGRDVRQFETALDRLGFSPGPVDDTYDGRTTAAVEAWYRAAGYDPVGAGAEADDQVSAAEAEVDAANQALLGAQTALDAAARPPSRAELTAARGEVTVAQTALDQATADRDEAVAAAPAADRARIRRQHDVLVAEAQARLDTARAALTDLQAPADTTTEQDAVDAAAATLDDASADLDDVRAVAGTRVPRSEVIFVPSLPRRVAEVHARVGAEVTGEPVLTLSSTELQVVARLAPAERQLVAVGDTVRIDEEGLGIDLSGTVTAVSETPDAEGDTAGTYAVRIRPVGAAADTRQLAGVNVRITIPVESTDGEVLAAPVAAVSTAADGASRVRRLNPDGTTDDVEVTVGLSAEGFVEVTPVDGGDALAAGDELVLGVR
jgi:peptidoglycan hydrolase-like protein with peptidoglycan-binding domain